MRKKVGIIKRLFTLLLIFLLSINSFAAIVSDNDGSAFITKAEFDALKSSFQSQIDSYNNSIDSKIDGAIASYLAGIKLSSEIEQTCILGENYKLPLRLCKSFFDVKDVLAATEWGINSAWSWGTVLKYKTGPTASAITDQTARLNYWFKRDPVLTDFGVFETAGGELYPGVGLGITFPIVGGTQGSYSTIDVTGVWNYDKTKKIYLNPHSAFVTVRGRDKNNFKWEHKTDSGYINCDDTSDTMVITLGSSKAPHFLLTHLDLTPDTKDTQSKFDLNTQDFDPNRKYLAGMDWTTGQLAGNTWSFIEIYTSADKETLQTIPRIKVSISGTKTTQLPCIATTVGFAPVPWVSQKSNTLLSMVGTLDVAVGIQRNLYVGTKKNQPSGKYANCASIKTFGVTYDSNAPYYDYETGMVPTENTCGAEIGTKIKGAWLIIISIF